MTALDAAAPATSTPGRRDGRLAGVALLLAVASLGVPAALSYDPWAWLVWGREIGDLALDTSAGPSWKPLPVLVTAVLAPLGEVAVPLFAVLVRAGAVVAVAVTYRLAARFAGPVAGVVAAGALLLTPDGDPRFLRLVLESHPGPLSVALVLLAVEAHLDGRHRRALAMVWSLALLRPEAWPFLVAHAWWSRRRGHAEPAAVLIVLASVPVLWFGMDWWGSGDPTHGAATAQVLADVPALTRLRDALAMAAGMVPVPLWVGAAAAVLVARRARDRRPEALLAGALAWSALVVVMAVALGYAAISRFYLPAAGVLCVLGGVGVVQVARTVRDDGRRWVATVGMAAVLVGAATVVPRLAGVGPVLAEVRDRGELEADLDRLLAEAGGPEAFDACDEVAMTSSGLLRSSIAWKLDRPLAEVRIDLTDGSGAAIVRTGGRGEAVVRARPGATVVARTDHWLAATVRCDRPGR